MRQHEQLDVVSAELQATLIRAETLRDEIDDLLMRQDTSTQEFEHRLVKGLEVIASLLLLQSQAATTCEAAAQLSVAARRIAGAGHLRSCKSSRSVS
jgi:two-component sensor histidine kinase